MGEFILNCLTGYTLFVYGAKQNGVDDDSQAMLDFINDVGGDEVTLIISKPILIGQSLEIPSNINLKFLNGGLLKLAPNVIITGINVNITAGLTQIFDLTDTGSAGLAGTWGVDVWKPQWFGAKANGTTDDSTAIQLALDIGGSVYLPPATYKIVNTIYVKKTGQKFFGCGNYASKILVDSGIVGVICHNTYNLTISDMWIHGGTYPLQLGNNSAEATFVGEAARLRISGGSVAGIFLYQTVGELNNVFVTGNADGIVSKTVANGGGYPTATVFNRCRIWGNTGRGIVLEHLTGGTFNSCTIESNGKEGVVFNAYDDASTWLRQVTFNECWFENNLTDGTLTSSTVLFNKLQSATLTDIRFINCYFSSVKNHAIDNVHIKGYISNITLVNNSYNNPYTNSVDLLSTTAYGLYISNSDDDLVARKGLICLTPDNNGNYYIYAEYFEYGTTGVVDKAGSNSPEGVVTAPIGSTYRRTNGGAGTTFYVKESGTGNTGWVAK